MAHLKSTFMVLQNGSSLNEIKRAKKADNNIYASTCDTVPTKSLGDLCGNALILIAPMPSEK